MATERKESNGQEQPQPHLRAVPDKQIARTTPPEVVKVAFLDDKMFEVLDKKFNPQRQPLVTKAWRRTRKKAAERRREPETVIVNTREQELKDIYAAEAARRASLPVMLQADFNPLQQGGKYGGKIILNTTAATLLRVGTERGSVPIMAAGAATAAVATAIASPESRLAGAIGATAVGVTEGEIGVGISGGLIFVGESTRRFGKKFGFKSRGQRIMR